MKKFLSAAMLLFACSLGTAFAQLPSVSLRTIEGKTIDTATLNNDGKPFIISFFASWCKPCNRELDNIAEKYEDWQEETGVKIIAISIDEGQNAQKVKPFVDNHGWEYEVILDPNSDFRRALGVPMIPHTFVIDGAGQIAMSHNGYTEGSEDEAIEKVRELLAAAPKAESECCKAKAEGECCKAKAEGECQHKCEKAEDKCEGKCEKAEGECQHKCEKAEGKCCKEQEAK